MSEYAADDHWRWIEAQLGVTCSKLGREVANVLGYVGRGIYNAPINRRAVKWDDPFCIEVNWNRSMSNWDFPELTLLVLECHQRMLRIEICPNMRTLKLMFHQRYTREKNEGTSKRMPTIQEMIEYHRADWQMTPISNPKNMTP